MATPIVNNLAPQLQAKTLATAQDNQTLLNLITFDRAPNAPFAVASSSAPTVPNLNADLCAGSHASDVQVPSGTVVLFTATTAPTSWLLCNGQAVSRTTYANLFALLGTAYGAGDGSTTFNVPNMQGVFPLGLGPNGTGSVLGEIGGALDHVHTYSQVLQHTHTVTVVDPGHDHTPASIPTATASDGAGSSTAVAPGSGSSVGTATTGISAVTQNPSGGAASGTTASNNPPYITFTFIIKI